MTTSRKFFAQTVSLTGSNPISIKSLMSTAGWGFELDANNDITTTLSLDSTIFDDLSFRPAADCYVGYDRYVRDTATPSAPPVPRTYKGVLAAANVTFDVADWFRGPVDAAQIWIYRAGASTTLEIIAQAS